MKGRRADHPVSYTHLDVYKRQALHWYRRSAEAGDFRGQANYAAILLQQGEVKLAVDLLQQALAHGSPSFMAHIVPALAASEHPQIRALVAHLTD